MSKINLSDWNLVWHMNNTKFIKRKKMQLMLKEIYKDKLSAKNWYKIKK
jgi:hypothetical protein